MAQKFVVRRQSVRIKNRGNDVIITTHQKKQLMKMTIVRYLYFFQVPAYYLTNIEKIFLFYTYPRKQSTD